MQEIVANRGIGEYLEALAGDQAAPGGGSAAGIVGALAAATGQMMASLTREPSEAVLEASSKLAELRQRALECARNDETSYGGYIEALALPKESLEEKGARKQAMNEAMEKSARVPLALAVVAVEIVDTLEAVILDGNRTVLGDADASIVLAQATVDICQINVNANLKFIKDETLADDLRTSIEAAHEMIVHLASERRAQIADRLAG